MLRIDKGAAYDYVRDALAIYGIRWDDTWAGMIVFAVLLSCVDSLARTVPDYSTVIEAVAEAEGLASDTVRRIITDFLRPIIGDSATGHRRRLGVHTDCRGVSGALDIIVRYVYARARAELGPVDTCRIVPCGSARAPQAHAEVPPHGGTDVNNGR